MLCGWSRKAQGCPLVLVEESTASETSALDPRQAAQQKLWEDPWRVIDHYLPGPVVTLAHVWSSLLHYDLLEVQRAVFAFHISSSSLEIVRVHGLLNK